jgi:hypothetical protein
MPERARRLRVAGHAREEAVEHQLLHLGARQLLPERAADEPRAAAGDGHRPALARRLLEEALLADAARLDQRLELVRVELVARAREPPLDAAGERQVHVVAAEQEVVAHRGAGERELPARVAHVDQ